MGWRGIPGMQQQQPLATKALLLVALALLAVLSAASPAQAISNKPLQPHAVKHSDNIPSVRHSSSGGMPLAMASFLQQQQHPNTSDRKAVAATDATARPPAPFEAGDAPAFLQYGPWALPESRHTRGMFNWYTNPYTFVLFGGMAGAFIGLGVWCIVASYTHKT
ncbi:hypothetical protein cyc_08744 [Cyclospora cayetanensis]|uniref:Transmembrane protein n=1 Tax=Cyclospora cayetanensis TaxID=88456 RepID=A0A1D3DAG2_9EIME|nr:hypothetical protein cyc_08744 [Cyclospora cayetanensis]